MNYLEVDYLNSILNNCKINYSRKSPFKYVIIDNFLNNSIANLIYSQYPKISTADWDGTTYIDQKNKFQKNKFQKNSIMDLVFKDLNSQDFLKWLNKLTAIEEELYGDEDLFGGGLHQSINGAFLNVHVDYNIHPKTKMHRRINVLVYLNKNWKDEYEGHLELWDMTKTNKNLIEKIAPIFNRCVIFETNDISYHGHPKPLKTPRGITRKSLATYYYTKNRPSSEIELEHNTKYVNTEGLDGKLKRIKSGLKAFKERVNRKKS
tara:strand:- start:517 stop:1305 length:789 start_codon:yes stop_codon:yes gene_type:complete